MKDLLKTYNADLLVSVQLMPRQEHPHIYWCPPYPASWKTLWHARKEGFYRDTAGRKYTEKELLKEFPFVYVEDHVVYEERFVKLSFVDGQTRTVGCPPGTDTTAKYHFYANQIKRPILIS